MSERELTLVTYNIHSAIGLDGRFDLGRVARVLRELEPDVVALQEVGDFRGRTEPGDHAAQLAAALSLEHAFGANVVRGDRRYGNAVLSRYPIARSWNLDLSYKRREPRGALVCELELGDGEDPGARLDLVCVHLGLGPRERSVQEERLANLGLPRASERVVVVAGDFNHLGDGPVAALERAHLRDAGDSLGQRERTCPALLPLFRFDRVLVGERVRPLSLRAHGSHLARRASDHLPLVARLAI